MHVAVFLLFGLIVGAFICLVAPGGAPRTWVVSMVIGAAGSMVGGQLASVLYWNQENDRRGYVLAVLGAVAFVLVHRVVRKRVPAPSS